MDVHCLHIWAIYCFQSFCFILLPYSVVHKLIQFPKNLPTYLRIMISRDQFKSLSHEWHSQFSILNCIKHTRTHTHTHSHHLDWFGYDFCSTFRFQLIKFNGMLYFHSFNIQTWSHSFLNCLHCSHWSHCPIAPLLIIH